MGKSNYTTSITGHRSVSVRRAIYRRSSPKDCCECPQYRMGRPIPGPRPTLPPTPPPTPPTPGPISASIIEIYDNISSKPKILCLHGGGQTSSSFEAQLNDLINALPEFDFVFPQAVELGNLWFKDPPGGKGDPTTNTDWALDSINYLNDYVTRNGSFHSILGFSQGVGMALLYLSHLQLNNKPILFEKVILLNGYLPTTHQGIADSIRRLNISTRMLKIVGVKDVDFYQLGKELYNELKLYGKNSNLEELHIDEYLYHFPVTSGLSGFNRVVSFLRS